MLRRVFCHGSPRQDTVPKGSREWQPGSKRKKYPRTKQKGKGSDKCENSFNEMVGRGVIAPIYLVGLDEREFHQITRLLQVRLSVFKTIASMQYVCIHKYTHIHTHLNMCMVYPKNINNDFLCVAECMQFLFASLSLSIFYIF